MNQHPTGLFRKRQPNESGHAHLLYDRVFHREGYTVLHLYFYVHPILSIRLHRSMRPVQKTTCFPELKIRSTVYNHFYIFRRSNLPDRIRITYACQTSYEHNDKQPGKYIHFHTKFIRLILWEANLQLFINFI